MSKIIRTLTLVVMLFSVSALVNNAMAHGGGKKKHHKSRSCGRYEERRSDCHYERSCDRRYERSYRCCDSHRPVYRYPVPPRPPRPRVIIDPGVIIIGG